ncbi:MAG: leucyl aminopeptidase [Devosia nanyangense]|uniref:Probable cytosol aminopeptidase n=1 Tax=Devosia nanyangense TaxID=1228055 RepID=A0A933KZA6_9HYPH|nr:leucyl aminopeptidase [Devosia nanyangense]
MPQTLTIRTAPLPVTPAGIIVIYAGEGMPPRGAAADVWATTGLDFARVAAGAGFKGKQGQVLDIAAPNGLEARRLFVLGAGKIDPDKPATAAAWTDRGGSLAAKLLAANAETAAVLLDGHEAMPAAIAELAAGLRLRQYRFDKYKARKKDDESANSLTVTLHVPDPAAADAAIASRMSVAEGTILARDLINEPANVLGTVEFAERAAALGALGVGIEVLGEAELRALGMEAMLAVAQGSPRPPRLVVMRWTGGKPDVAPIAFVGKGVVFDTGGISIKPALNMEDMKGDMGGAAAVTGLMQALATRKAKVNAVGVIGLVENMPSGTAIRPGDIVRAASGVTIEIVNTDAEGRLVLADALWYTQEKLKPLAMVNLATLTGAIGVALGSEHAGLFSNNDEFAAKLLAAGLATGEKLWRMPMGPAYDKLIESRFADIKNSGGRPAGSITAAQFLARFVGNVPWAHLDIAGVALGSPSSETNAGWTSGFGVTLLDRLVRDNYEDK